MSKEKFERSKPHLNIGTIGQLYQCLNEVYFVQISLLTSLINPPVINIIKLNF